MLVPYSVEKAEKGDVLAEQLFRDDGNDLRKLARPTIVVADAHGVVVKGARVQIGVCEFESPPIHAREKFRIGSSSGSVHLKDSGLIDVFRTGYR